MPLKQLCADILDISIDGLNKAKNEGTDIGLKIDDGICTILSEETGIPLENVKDICYGKVLNNIREMLQFIGTDLIRAYNMNWHVNKIRQMIEPDKKSGTAANTSNNSSDSSDSSDIEIMRATEDGAYLRNK